jgi:hypothetical protein
MNDSINEQAQPIDPNLERTQRYREIRRRVDELLPWQKKGLIFHDVSNIFTPLNGLLSIALSKREGNSRFSPELVSEYHKSNSLLKSNDADEVILAMQGLLRLYQTVPFTEDPAFMSTYEDNLNSNKLRMPLLPLLLASTQFLQSPSPSSYFALESEAVSLGELTSLFKIDCPEECAGEQLSGARAIVAFNYLKNAKAAVKNFDSAAEVKVEIKDSELVIENPSKSKVPEWSLEPNEKEDRLHAGLTICELYLRLLGEERDIIERRVIKDYVGPDSYLVTTRLKLEQLAKKEQ